MSPPAVLAAGVHAVTTSGSEVVAREPVTTAPTGAATATGEAADEVTSGKRRSMRLSSKPAIVNISHKKQRKK